MNIRTLLWIISSVITCFMTVTGVELTFELPDNAKECFYEEIQNNVSCTLEYQVVTGGHYDVDVTLQAPNKEILHKQIKTQFGNFPFTTKVAGTYVACFSNEFSTFSHKIVYMDFHVGNEDQLPGFEEHVTVMTQMESSAQEIHRRLEAAVDFQTHHRLKEAQSRKRAEDLNERVMWWSIIETLLVLVVGISQVFVLKNFFSEKNHIKIQSRM